MALKQTQGITEKLGGSERPIPVLHMADLREQLRSRAVRTRLERVHKLVKARAQQNV